MRSENEVSIARENLKSAYSDTTLASGSLFHLRDRESLCTGGLNQSLDVCFIKRHRDRREKLNRDVIYVELYRVRR